MNGENICEPGVDLKAKLHCSATCINGICSKSHECQCNPGYEISETGFCVEKCILDCKNGKCANQECWCNAGYSLSENDTTVCLPVCINPCANGNCVEPNKCKCLEGKSFDYEFASFYIFLNISIYLKKINHKRLLLINCIFTFL